MVKVLERSQGHAVNLTTLTLSAHTGSHVDAPLHFADVDESIDQMDLKLYWGHAQVVTSAKPAGPLFPDDFAGYDLSLAPRLLVRSPASDLEQTVFPAEYVYPTPELAAHLAGQGVILFGSDAPSMDAMDNKSLAGHNALLRHGVAILEWLDLRHAADGLYELVALPLKIAGGDGSPVRAALRKDLS
jgi:arylformamidase